MLPAPLFHSLPQLRDLPGFLWRHTRNAFIPTPRPRRPIRAQLRFERFEERDLLDGPLPVGAACLAVLGSAAAYPTVAAECHTFNQAPDLAVAPGPAQAQDNPPV